MRRPCFAAWKNSLTSIDSVILLSSKRAADKEHIAGADMTFEFLLAFSSSLLAALVVAWVLFNFFKTALAQGMASNLDSTICGFHVDALAIAISDFCYEGRGDYSGLLAVRDVLGSRGLSEEGHPARRDLALIDRALQEAASLDWNTVLSSKRFVVGLEPGYVDLIRLAFRLFGLRIDSVFKLYALILAFSAALFAIAFWQAPGFLWALVALLMAFHVVVFGTDVLDFQAKSILDKRLIAILAVIPAFHLMLVMASYQAITVYHLLPVLGQSLLFAWLFWMRNSTGWLVVSLAALTVLLLVLAPFYPDSHIVYGLWAPALAMGMCELMTAYKHWRVHPCYHSSELTMAYPKWHSAYVGFAEDMETFSRNRLPLQEDKLLDVNACLAVVHVLKTSPVFGQAGLGEHAVRLQKPFITFNLSAFFGLKWAVYEQAARIAVFDYVRANLKTMPRLYFYLKPRAILRNLAYVLRPLPAYLNRHRLSAALFLLPALPCAYHLSQSPMQLIALGLPVLCLLAIAPLPLLWAFCFRPPGYSMAETAWMSLFALWSAMACLGAMLFI